jgi:hypothetical protein
MLLGLGIVAGLYFAAHSVKSVNFDAAKNPATQPAAGNTPLQNAMNALQSSANSGMNALNQVTLLQNMLGAHNDNDPAYDTAMRNLTPETKIAMQTKYRSTAREKRNDRGTIVFVLGREIKTDSDLKFMEEVLNEAPCLSLANCEADADMSAHVDSESGVDTTLVYPQLVAIRSLGTFIGADSGAGADLKAAARTQLEQASRNHRSEHVRQAAESALAEATN